MKKILIILVTISAASCTSGNDVSIEEIKAEKELNIEKEKTKQLEIKLKIEREKK